jgi:hypothetical protein
MLTYAQRKNNFCSKSCSAQYNNRRRLSKDSSNEKRKETLISKHTNIYYLNPKQCVQCYTTIDYNNRKHDFCSTACIKQHQSLTNVNTQTAAVINSLYQNDTKMIKCICAKTGEVFYSPTWRKYSNTVIYKELKLYRLACRFTFGISDRFPNAHLIQQHGWYHPVTNPSGVSRDHKLSVADGFKLGIEPEIMRHPANCTIMLHSDNQHKNKKSYIDLQTLINLMDTWQYKT